MITGNSLDGGNPTWSRAWTRALLRCLPALFSTIPMIQYVIYKLQNSVPMTNISMKEMLALL